MLIGCFQVDILKDDWIIKHMEDTYNFKCMSNKEPYNHRRQMCMEDTYNFKCMSNKQPATTDGRCVDLCFANFQVDVLIMPLKIPLHKHKAVFFKTTRKTRNLRLKCL
ncbi:hypothetical protein MTO96_032576 [Rhipicephalus appendiculatus]